jgi:hypothetical protein
MALGESDVRRLALALPEAVEMDHHGAPSFRVRGKIFCTVRAQQGRMMVKLDAEDQHNLCAGHPGTVYPVPGFWGTKGSTYVSLSDVDEAFAATLLRLAWMGAAPKTLARRTTGGDA